MADQEIPFQRIGGYRVTRRLATGGTSDVLLARAEGPHGFERTVVLKLLLRQFQRDAGMEKMFAREAAAYARLSHPAIVKLYDFFAAEGQLVMVLEFVDGLPLNRFRAGLRKSGDALDDRASIFVASRIFAALAAAHGARDPETGEFSPMIHRDVNPSNVLIPWDGHVKLADFGIAKVAGIPPDTQSGFIKGTYGYMAPEQVRGEPVTVRTDVYAASLILWELLARRKAIQRGALPEMEVLRAMAEPSLPSLDVLRPDLPARLREAVTRGLEPVADQRSLTAEEMLVVLRESVTSNEGRNVLVDVLSRVRPETADLANTQSRPGAETRPRGAVPAPPESDTTAVTATAAATPKAPEVRMPLGARTMMGIAPTSAAAMLAQAAPRIVPSPSMELAATLLAPSGSSPLFGASLVPPAVSSAPPPVLSAAPPAKIPEAAPPPAFFAAATQAAGESGALPPVRVPISTHPPAPTNGGGMTQVMPAMQQPPVPAIAAATALGAAAPTEPTGTATATGPSAPVAFGDPTVSTTPPPPPRRGGLYGVVGGALVASAIIVAGLLFLSRSPDDAASEHTVTGSASSAASATATTSPTATATSTAAPTTTATASASARPATAPSASSPAAPTTAAAVAAPTPSAPEAVTASPPPASLGTTKGRILTPPSMGSHRVFVDNKYVGDTPAPLVVLCGEHTIQIGSHGTPRTVDVPCGADVTLVGR